MWIKEQESIFCNEFTANSFVPLHTPIQGSIQEAALYLSPLAVARLVTQQSVYLWWTWGRKNSKFTTTTSLAKPNFLSRRTKPTLPFLAPGDVTECKHWPQHSSTSARDSKDTTSTSSSSSSAPVCSLGQTAVQAAASEPLLITGIASWFCFCEPPFPYQLLRKPLAIYCQACFEIGFFNQQVNILYYCGFRLIIMIILF